MERGCHLLFIVSFFTLTAVTSFASQNQLKVGYSCQSDRPVNFSNGDESVRIGYTKEMTLSLESPKNLNLVIGQHKALIWVRQPYGTDERFLSVFRVDKGIGYNSSPEEVAMGRVGEYAKKSLSFSFYESGASVRVDCLVMMTN